MKAIGFFFCWNTERRLDPYFDRFAKAFAKAGIELKIILGNEIMRPGVVASKSPFVDTERIVRFINQEDPDFVFSVNNAGMARAIREKIRVPVIKWLVDDIPHLFMHDGEASEKEIFGPGDTVICYTSTLTDQIKRQYPIVAQNVHFVPHSTEMDELAKPLPQIYDISFVGSCLDTKPVINLLRLGAKKRQSKLVVEALKKLNADYNTSVEELSRSEELQSLLKRGKITPLVFKRVLSDALTSQGRVSILSKITDLGLVLFGNQSWLESVGFTNDLVDCYQFGENIDSYEKLAEVYQKSKISVHVPNPQNCAGLSTRVIDAMATSSLLITEYREDSDLFKLFGKDCPVPMYRNTTHLRELCEYYLKNEDKRLEVVRHCNQLITSEFNIVSRLREMLTFAGIQAPAVVDAKPMYKVVPINEFYGLPLERSKTVSWTKELAVVSIKKLIFSSFEILFGRKPSFTKIETER